MLLNLHLGCCSARPCVPGRAAGMFFVWLCSQVWCDGRLWVFADGDMAWVLLSDGSADDVGLEAEEMVYLTRLGDTVLR